jgi:DNA-binding GntR family transcriptional regulator
MIQKNAAIMTSEEIFNDMCKKIEKMDFPPGISISENEVSKMYNVSRTVIRVVFTKLKDLKLIDVFPQRGTYVSLIDLNHISDILFVRTAIENEIINRVMNVSDKTVLVEKLEKNIELQQKFIGSKEYGDEFANLDKEFHDIIADFINKKNVYRFIAEQYIHVRRWRYFEIARVNRLDQLIEEHENMFQAIKENDKNKAMESLRTHLDTVSRISFAVKEKYPEFFL